MKAKIINWITVIPVMLLLISYNNPSEDNSFQSYISKVKNSGFLPIEAIEVPLKMRNFNYPEYGERPSPFANKKGISKNWNNLIKEQRLKQPLEQFPLESLRFVGILKNKSTYWALIAHLEAEVSIVKLGNYLGNNQGKVTSINEEFLSVEEKFFKKGKWLTKITQIPLKRN